MTGWLLRRRLPSDVVNRLRQPRCSCCGSRQQRAATSELYKPDVNGEKGELVLRWIFCQPCASFVMPIIHQLTTVLGRREECTGPGAADGIAIAAGL